MIKDPDKLKIGFVLDDGLDNEDGVQQYILSLGRWLVGEGHDVHYLVGETARSDIPNTHSLAKNISVRFNGNNLTIPIGANSSEVRRFLRSQKFDILHVQTPYSPLFGAKVVSSADKQTAIIGTFHILPFGRLAFFGTFLLGLVLRNNLKQFDRHIAVSSAAKNFASKTFKIHAEIVPNMVNIEKYSTKSSAMVKKSLSGTIRLVFVGRLVRRKGCGYLLDALGQLSAYHPEVNYELMLCGKGELLSELKDKARQLGIEDRINFLGYVSENEKIAHLQKADIAVFPSYSGESFGIVLLEAMAAGAGVVLGGKNPGYESVLGEIEGSIVDVRDTANFSNAILKLITDDEWRRNIHISQQRLVKDYDVPLVGNKILDIYRDCKKLRSN